MNNVTSFDDHKARRYAEQALLGFYGDPPDSDYQRGFLAGIAALYAEGLGNALPADDRIAAMLSLAGFGDHPHE